MNRPLVPLLLAAALLAACGGDTTGKLVPVLDLESTVLDFGHVTVDGEGVRELAVRNEGNRALVIENAAAPAPFVVTEVPGPIEPGRTGHVVVAFRPSAEGAASGVLTFGSNDEQAPETQIDLTGVGVVALVTVEPSPLDFGDVYWALHSPTVFERVTVRNDGTGPFEIRSASLTDDADGVFRIQDDRVTGTFAPGESRTIELGCLPSGLGAFSGSLTLETDAASYGDMVVPLQATGVGPTVEVCVTAADGADLGCALPAALPFGPVPIDLATTGEVAVRNVGTRDLTLKEVRLSGGSGTFTVTPVAAECVPGEDAEAGVVATIAPGAACPLEVTYTPTEYAAHAGLVTLRTDDRIRPDIQVSLSGHVMRADLEARPMGITMGSSGNDTCYEEEAVNLVNCGDQDLVVHGIELLPADEDGDRVPDSWPAPDTLTILDAPGLPLTLPALGPENCAGAEPQATVMLAFSPKMNGVWDGRLHIRSNDPLTPDLAVEVLAQKSAIGTGCQD